METKTNKELLKLLATASKLTPVTFEEFGYYDIFSKLGADEVEEYEQDLTRLNDQITDIIAEIARRLGK